MSDNLEHKWAPLSIFFEKVKKLIPPQESKIHIIQDVVAHYTKITLPKEKIKVKNSVVFLEISPVQKNEVILKKEPILSFLRKNFPKIEITDIR
jgi:hypothetical protein